MINNTILQQGHPATRLASLERTVTLVDGMIIYIYYLCDLIAVMHIIKISPQSSTLPPILTQHAHLERIG